MWEPEPLRARSPLGVVLIGAVAGGVLGYLCWSPDGRRVHQRIDRWLDDVIDEMRRLQDTTARVRTAFDEARRAFRSVEDGDPPAA